MNSAQGVELGGGELISARLAARSEVLPGVVDPMAMVRGKLVRMVGLTLEATGCQAAIGSRCHITAPSGASVEAEVVGFADQRLFLMPIGSVHGLTPNALVIPVPGDTEVEVGDALIGRVIDGAGRPLDGAEQPQLAGHTSLQGQTVNPLQRALITEPLDVGIRAINALLTVGRGQRLGLFAGSGVGKSTLLGLMTQYTDADVVVVGLIGERGREVQEFIVETLGPAGLARAVVVASPADDSPLMRLHGAWRATAIAEYFRDQGKNVLLLMDSLTRFAQAQREIALAIGEPPVTRGYPPSVFSRLPQLVERAGKIAGKGSITAIYTVLMEGDDENDPVVDSARAILDGHIILSRRIADSGRYPAIDIESSVSRVMNRLVGPERFKLVQNFKQLYSLYEQNRDLISVGAYVGGSDARIDQAIQAYPRLQGFLRQEAGQSVTLDQSFSALDGLLSNLQMPA
ncbi:flagellar protein export ATPase FliI [Gammaproteobacteria bacterium 53_120_T64]|nr:flagellar protein export ATPase FliI [Gammaproteobacteria bacterium 53_120_T64]